MTTTAEAPAPAPTLREVEEAEGRAAELVERLEALRSEEQRLTAQLAEAHAAAEPDQEAIAALVAQRREAVKLRADIEAALPVLRERTRERRELALRGEAERRLREVSRAHGSLASEIVADGERLAQAVAAVVDRADKLNERHAALQLLEVEVLVLRDRWPDLEPPRLERVHAPALQPQAVDALARVRAVTLDRPRALPSAVVTASKRQAGELHARVAGTPTAEILAAVGHEFDPAAHDARHREAMAEGRDAQDAERRAEAERYDAWVRSSLADGPVEVGELERLAEADAMRFRRDRNHHGASVREALRRVEAFVVLRPDDKGAPRYWTLARAEGFVVPSLP